MHAIGTGRTVFAIRQLPVTGVLLLIVGCQQNYTTVTGKVTLDGKPVSIAADARGTIVFQPESGQGTTATGLLDAGGSFKLANGASSEVMPGKYQVAVSIVQLLPKSEGAEQGAKRITPAKYASVNSSGLEANVLPGANELTFDMSSKAEEGALGAAAQSDSGAKTQDPSSKEK